MIRTTIFAAVAALALSGVPAMAQTLTQDDVGSFVRDANGTAIGSLKAIHGNEAVVWIGFFNTPGNHLVTVPLSQLSASNGQLVLNNAPASAVASNW